MDASTLFFVNDVGMHENRAGPLSTHVILYGTYDFIKSDNNNNAKKRIKKNNKMHKTNFSSYFNSKYKPFSP